MTTISVALVTNNRCPELLAAVVDAYTRLGLEVHLAYDTGGNYCNLLADVFERIPPDNWVLVGQDDVLPVDPLGWARLRTLPLYTDPDSERGLIGSIRAVRLINAAGHRWYDWAYHVPNEGSYLQRYDERHPATYITGAAQLWSPMAACYSDLYRGKIFHEGDDQKVCWEAEKQGITLLPPITGGPTLIHLDQKAAR